MQQLERHGNGEDTKVVTLFLFDVIGDYEKELGVGLADDVKTSIKSLLGRINDLQFQFNPESIESILFFVSWISLYDRDVTQPIINALTKLKASCTTQAVSVTLRTKSLFDDVGVDYAQ